MCVCVCVWRERDGRFGKSGKMRKKKQVEKWINLSTDNGFKNDISSLVQKDFIRMTSFSKVQYKRKSIIKNKKMGCRKKERQKRKEKREIEIHIRVVAEGVIGCDCDSFWEHLGNG